MSFEDFPVFFPGPSATLSGVVCVPSGDIQEVGVVLIPSSAASRVHRNAMWVRAARALAELGYASIRADFRGVGDSGGSALIFDMEEPFSDDVAAAADFFSQATGIERLVIVGTCYGSRCAVSAVGSIATAEGLVLMPTELNAPVARGKPRLRTRVKRWIRQHERLAGIIQRDRVMKARAKVASGQTEQIRISRPFERDLMAFLERGEVWFVYGDEDKRYPQLQACLGEIEPLLSTEQRDRLHVRIEPGRWIEKFHSLDDQQITIDAVVDAVGDIVRGSQPAEGRV